MDSKEQLQILKHCNKRGLTIYECKWSSTLIFIQERINQIMKNDGNICSNPDNYKSKRRDSKRHITSLCVNLTDAHLNRDKNQFSGEKGYQIHAQT